MPAGLKAPSGTSNPSSGAGTIPFLLGTHEYAEKMAVDTWQLTAAAQEFVHNITPGGFLRGIRLLAQTSVAGVAGTATADSPFILFQSVSLENIDGSPILYPMNGFSYMLALKYFQPWLGDPAKNYFYNIGGTVNLNPGWALPLRVEIRNTAAVLANTDARAQYRVRYTLNTSTAVGTGYTTAPTIQVTEYMEAYTQVDPTDLNGNPIQDLPDGLNVARVIRHQFATLNNAGASNTIQLTNTGNELRGILLLTRNAAGARVDALSDPIRVRLDDRSLGVFSPDEVFLKMNDFYATLNQGTSVRETGLYAFPRFRDPGNEAGVFWLPTTNATYLMFESTSAAGFSGPGTVEIITDEVIPVGPIPADLEGC